MSTTETVPQPSRPGLLADATKIAVGLTPIVVAVACLTRAPLATQESGLRALLLVLLYALAFRTEFTSSRGCAVPTQPVLVAMLLTLPATWVPALVLAAIALSSLDAPLGEGPGWKTVLRLAMSGFNTVAPVLVLLAVAQAGPAWPPAAVVAVAVVAQLAVDGLTVLAVAWTAGGLAGVLAPLLWTLTTDLLLSVVGTTSVLATGPALPGLLLVGTPVLLVRLLAQDREEVVEQARSLATTVDEVAREARRDPMTGLLNRRGWDEVVEAATGHLQTGDHVATVLVADLDRLKATNDSYGHLAGDDLICAFADLLAEHLPAAAAVARVGGDEFHALVVTPAGEPTPDLLTAVRSGLLTAAPAGPVRLSASLGQSTYPPAPSLEAAVDSADHASRVDKMLRRESRELIRELERPVPRTA